MDNMQELEKRWYFYKIQNYLRSLNGVGLVAMLSLGGYYASTQIQNTQNLLNLDNQVFTAKKELRVEVQETMLSEVKTPITVLEESIESVDKERYNVALEPIIPIIDMEKEERKVVTTKKTYRVSSSSSHSAKKLVRAKPSAYLTASELSTINASIDTRKLKKINLNGSSDNYIESIKKKFSRSQQPREALLLAKAFYGEKNYTLSEKWALKANNLDNKLDESWFIFAKSKAKLGKRDEAIKILTSFYKKSHSAKAKALIIKIKTERL